MSILDLNTRKYPGKCTFIIDFGVSRSLSACYIAEFNFLGRLGSMRSGLKWVHLLRGIQRRKGACCAFGGAGSGASRTQTRQIARYSYIRPSVSETHPTYLNGAEDHLRFQFDRFGRDVLLSRADQFQRGIGGLLYLNRPFQLIGKEVAVGLR